MSTQTMMASISQWVRKMNVGEANPRKTNSGKTNIGAKMRKINGLDNSKPLNASQATQKLAQNKANISNMYSLASGFSAGLALGIKSVSLLFLLCFTTVSQAHNNQTAIGVNFGSDFHDGFAFRKDSLAKNVVAGAGNTATYRIVVARLFNAGSDATNIIIEDTLPPGFTFVSVAVGPSTTIPAVNISNAVSPAVGASGTISFGPYDMTAASFPNLILIITVQPPTVMPAALGKYDNTMSLTFDEAPGVTILESPHDHTLPAHTHDDVTVVSSAVTGSVKNPIGGDVDVGQIQIQDAQGNVVNDTNGAPLSISGVSGDYAFYDVPPGDWFVVKTNNFSPSISDGDDSPDGDAIPDLNTNDGSIPVTVTTGDVDADNNFVNVAHDLTMDKLTVTPIIEAGGQAIFNIVARNFSGRDFTGIYYVDTLPPGFTFSSATYSIQNFTTGVFSVEDVPVPNSPAPVFTSQGTIPAGTPIAPVLFGTEQGSVNVGIGNPAIFYDGFSLDSGDMLVVTLVADVDANIAAGTYTNTVDGEDDNDEDHFTDLTASVLAQNPVANLEVTKTANITTDLVEGDVVTYTYVVHNPAQTPAQATAGEVPMAINDVTLTDMHLGAGPQPVPTDEAISQNISGLSNDVFKDGSIDTLAAGDSAAFTATYTITAADIANVVPVTNIVTAHGTIPSSTITLTEPTDNAVVTLATTADLEVVKTLETAGPYTAGDSIAYKLVVTNNGPLDETNVVVTDTPVGLTLGNVSGSGCTALPCTIPTLANGASATIFVTATIDSFATGPSTFSNLTAVTGTQTDSKPINNTPPALVNSACAIGEFQNSALASSDTTDPDLTDNFEVVCDVATAPLANIGITKAVNVMINAAGVVTAQYTITANNTGNVSGSYDLTDAITVPVGVTATITSAPAHAGADGTDGTTGAFGLTGGTIITGENLAASTTETWVYTLTYTADNTAVANGGCNTATPDVVKVDNAASLDGGTTNVQACVDVPLPANLDITKTSTTPVATANPNEYTIDYTITVVNTSAAGLYTVTDDLQFSGGITIGSVGAVTSSANVSTGVGTLHPSNVTTIVTNEPILANATETFNFTVTYTVTAAVTTVSADCTIDNFFDENTGTLNRAELTSPTMAVGKTDVACEPVTPLSNITLSKAVSTTTDAAGTVTAQYTITAENTGNGPGSYDLTDVITVPAGVTATLTSSPAHGGEADGANGATGAFTIAGGTIITSENLAVGLTETWLYTLTYETTDVSLATDNGCNASTPDVITVDNAASLDGGTTTVQACVDVPLLADIEIIKSISTIDKSFGNAALLDKGDKIQYTFVVTNTGNVKLDPISVSDSMVGAVSCDVTSLAAGAQTNCQADALYVLTQPDVTAGGIENTATTTGQPSTPVGGVQPPVVTDVSDTGTEPGPVGTGTVTTVGSPGTTETSSPIGMLMNSGDPKDDPTTLIIPIVPELTIDKKADSTTGLVVGQTVTYTYVVSNTGNAIMTDVSIADMHNGLTNTLSAVTGESLTTNGGDSSDATVDGSIDALAPGDVAEFTSTYVVSQADIDAGGKILNTATANGTPTPPTTLPPGTTVPPFIPPTDDEEVEPIPQTPAISLTKTAGTPTIVEGIDVTITDADDTITYTLVFKNTGNVTLKDVFLSDPLVNPIASCTVLSDSSAFTNDGSSTLAVGESVTCTATYTLLQSDMDAGVRDNKATITSKDPKDVSLPPVDKEVSTPLNQETSITLVKSSSVLSGSTAGSTVDYTFVIKNTGNVTLDDVTLTDQTLGLTLVCPTNGDASPFTLVAGASETCTATYTLTATDISEANAGTSAYASVVNGNLEVANTADVIGTPPVISGLEKPTALSGALATAQLSAAIAMIKSGSAIVDKDNDGKDSVGDEITYTYVVTNNGTATLQDVLVTEDAALFTGTGTDPTPTDEALTNDAVPTLDSTDASTNGSWDTLAPGDEVTFSATYALTKLDIDAGEVKNTASVTGTPPTGIDPPPKAISSVVVPVKQDPSIVIVKSITAIDKTKGNSATLLDADDEVTYSFSVTNTGNVTLDPIVVTDSMVGSVSCADTSLAAGANTTCTADNVYVLTQTDVDAGGIENTATATGTPPVLVDGIQPPDVTDVSDAGTKPEVDGTVTTEGTPGTTETPSPVGTNTNLPGDPEEDPTTLLVPPKPSISVLKSIGTIDKSLGNPALLDAGDKIEYTFVVTNTGNVTLDPVAVSDSMVGSISCDATSLAPAGITSCTADALYVLTQPDVDAGGIENTATATGTPPTPVGGGTPLDVTDISDAGTKPNPNGTGTVVTQDDPEITETPSPIGTNTNNGGDPEEDPTTLLIPPTPSIEVIKSIATIDKTKGNASLLDAGDTVKYTFVVTNTGNVTLDPIAVSDPMLGGISCLATSLAPAATTNCTADALYVLTQADVTAGGVDNTATATGTPPTPVGGGTPVNVTDISDAGTEPEVDGTVTTVATPGTTETPNPLSNPPTNGDPKDDPTVLLVPSVYSLALTKLADQTTGLAVGDTVTYTYKVSNTGNAIIEGVTVGDAHNGSGPVPTPNNAVLNNISGNSADVASDNKVDTLAPGDNATFTGTYVITQADVNAGGDITNTATATPTNPPTGFIPPTAIEIVTPAPSAPAISLTKTAGTPTIIEGADATITDTDDTIEYTLVFKNTGNVTLDNVTLADTLLGSTFTSCTVLSDTSVFNNDGSSSLAVGESVTCKGTYTLLQSDIDAGERYNKATVTSDKPNGDPLPPVDVEVTTSLNQETSITLLKTAGVPSVAQGADNSIADAGDTIAYTFDVTNTGNVTLDNVTVTDQTLSLALSCPGAVAATPIVIPSIGAGDTVQCTASYTITAADMLGTPSHATVNGAGEVEIANIADVIGTPPATSGLTPPTAQSGALAKAQLSAAIAMVKSASAIDDKDSDGKDSVGDEITYTYVVTNNGTATLQDVLVTEDAALFTGTGTDPAPTGEALTNDAAPTLDSTDASGANGSWDTLAPGDEVTFSAVYVLTKLDIDAGEVKNTASVTGTPPTGIDPPPKVISSVVVPVKQDPSIVIVKSITAINKTKGNSAILLDADDEVTYSFSVTNTGNVTLDPIAVTDSMVGSVSCADTLLAAGANTTCTADNVYVLTQTDVDAGGIENTATATGTPPTPVGGGTPVDVTDVSDAGTKPNPNGTGTVVTQDDPETTETPSPIGTNTNLPGDPEEDPTTLIVPPKPSISVVKSIGTIDKSLGNPALLDAGDKIEYTFVVTNTGNVTLDPVAVSDSMVGSISCDATSLAPAATTNCTADALYVLTQADVTAGGIENTATATGTPPTPVGGGTPLDVTDISDAGTKPNPNGTGTVVTQDDPETTETPSPIGTNTNSGLDPEDDPTTLLIPPAPSISVIKSITAIDATKGVNNTKLDADDEVQYGFTVTNTGNVPLDPISVTDAMLVAAGITINCPAGPLAPNTSVPCIATAPYVLTQADVNAGGIENTAIATGTPPLLVGGGIPVDVTDVSDAGTKPNPNGTGTVVTQDDPATTDTPSPIGGLINTPDPQDDPTTLLIPSDPSIEVIKSIDAIDKSKGDPTILDAGDLITYKFVVTNTGNVLLDPVSLNDPKLANVSCLATSLAPTFSTTCTADAYVITQPDVDAGGVANTAIATGTPPTPIGGGTPVDVTDVSDAGTKPETNGTVTPEGTPNITETPNPLSNPPTNGDPKDDPTVLLLPESPAIEVLKSIDNINTGSDGLLNQGDLITYKFVVTNTGNVTLKSILLADSKLTGISCPTATLAPKGSIECTANAYAISAGDVANGGVVNTATVEGVSPKDVKVTDTSDTGTQPEDDGTVTGVNDPTGTETPNPLDDPSNPPSTGDPKDNDPTVLLVPPVTVVDVETYIYGQPKSVDIINNDVSGSPLVPTSLKFVIAGMPVGTTVSTDGKTLTVPNEGVWEVDNNGIATFTPESTFMDDPTPPSYFGLNNKGLASNVSQILLTGQPPVPENIPTLSEWAMIMLIMLLGLVAHRQGLARRRKHYF